MTNTPAARTADLPAEAIVGRRWRAHATGTGTVEAVDVIQGYVILLVDGERVAFTDDEVIGLAVPTAPAPATDEQLAAAIARGLTVGTLVAFEDVDWDDLDGVDQAPAVDPYLARYGTPDQHDPATCAVCATFPADTP